MESLSTQNFRFGFFELDTSRRVLLKSGEPLALHSKAFDLLLALVENHGQVLTKDELLERVWPGQFVEEGNLTVQISALRKIFGEHKNEHKFIVTLPGRGYSFVAELTDQTNGDIVLERHSLSRIIVEETINGNDPDSNAPAAVDHAIGSRRIVRKPFLIAGALLAVVLIAAGIFFFRSRSGSAAAFGRISIKRLTSTGNITHARISPDGKLYAYVTFENGRRTLWLGHVDGGEPKQLREAQDARYISLKFAPDGRSLYYTMLEGENGSSLFKLPVFGGAPEKIKEDIPGSFTISPDGNEIAFFRTNKKTGKQTLRITALSDSDEKEIASSPTSIGFAPHNPSWSPDGKLIAVGAPIDETGNASEVFVVDEAKGRITPLTKSEWSEVGSTVWLHDGSGLIVVATEKGSILPQLWHVTYPGGSVERIITDLNLYGSTASLSDDDKTLLLLQQQIQSNIWTAPADALGNSKQITFGSIGRADGRNGLDWTPDGRIIYTATAENSITIWTASADGSNPKQIIPNGGINDFPEVAADGKNFVFESNRSGHFAIWRADIDGGNMRKLTGDEAASQPTISPNGQWIAYVGQNEGPGPLYRIPAEGGEPVKLIDDNVSWPRFSPDGNLIACGFHGAGRRKLAIFSASGGAPIKIFDVPRLGEFAFGIRWTPDGKAVTYRDRPNGIWRQDLDGGDPQMLDGFPRGKQYAYNWSRDGRYFAFTLGNEISDLVLVESDEK